MSSSTPRPTMPPAAAMIVLAVAPVLLTVSGVAPLNERPRTNMWQSASMWVVPRPWTSVPT